MDSQFSFFGFKFGMDPILGLIPGSGDLITSLVSVYLIWLAAKFNLPSNLKWRMLVNMGMEAFIGSVPILGDIFDFVFKAHLRNMDIIDSHLKLDGKSDNA